MEDQSIEYLRILEKYIHTEKLKNHLLLNPSDWVRLAFY